MSMETGGLWIGVIALGCLQVRHLRSLESLQGQSCSRWALKVRGACAHLTDYGDPWFGQNLLAGQTGDVKGLGDRCKEGD